MNVFFRFLLSVLCIAVSYSVSATTVEVSPQFPGGVAALHKFIADNMRYPQTAFEDSIEGRVIVSFIVEKDGSVSNPRVIRSKHHELNDEAIRIVSSFPKWQPGYFTTDKKPRRVNVIVPIVFQLKDNRAGNSD